MDNKLQAALNLYDYEIARLHNLRKGCIIKAQSECQHNNLACCAHEENEFVGTKPPILVCTECGLAEYAWCGNNLVKLKDSWNKAILSDMPMMSRDKLTKLILIGADIK